MIERDSRPSNLLTNDMNICLTRLLLREFQCLFLISIIFSESFKFLLRHCTSTIDDVRVDTASSESFTTNDRFSFRILLLLCVPPTQATQYILSSYKHNIVKLLKKGSLTNLNCDDWKREREREKDILGIQTNQL